MSERTNVTQGIIETGLATPCAAASKVAVFQPTILLRCAKSGQLQQWWQDQLSSNGEWRDVPTEGDEMSGFQR